VKYPILHSLSNRTNVVAAQPENLPRPVLNCTRVPVVPNPAALGLNKPGDPRDGRSTSTSTDRHLLPPSQVPKTSTAFSTSRLSPKIFSQQQTRASNPPGCISSCVSHPRHFSYSFCVCLRCRNIAHFVSTHGPLRTQTVEHFPSTSTLDENIDPIRNQSS